MLELTINGKEVTLDFLDVDVMERHQKALELLQKNPYIQQEGARDLDGLRRICDLAYDYFDTLLGEGQGNVILEGKRNVGVCVREVNACVLACSTYLSTTFPEEVQALQEEMEKKKAEMEQIAQKPTESQKPKEPEEDIKAVWKGYLEDEDFLQVLADFVNKKVGNPS